MDFLSDIFVTPLSYGFMQRALVAAILIGAVCSVLSCYLVLRGWSLMGDAISHAVLPGIVLAVVLGIPIAIITGSGGSRCGSARHYRLRVRLWYSRSRRRVVPCAAVIAFVQLLPRAPPPPRAAPRGPPRPRGRGRPGRCRIPETAGPTAPRTPPLGPAPVPPVRSRRRV